MIETCKNDELEIDNQEYQDDQVQWIAVLELNERVDDPVCVEVEVEGTDADTHFVEQLYSVSLFLCERSVVSLVNDHHHIYQFKTQDLESTFLQIKCKWDVQLSSYHE